MRVASEQRRVNSSAATSGVSFTVHRPHFIHRPALAPALAPCQQRPLPAAHQTPRCPLQWQPDQHVTPQQHPTPATPHLHLRLRRAGRAGIRLPSRVADGSRQLARALEALPRLAVHALCSIACVTGAPHSTRSTHAPAAASLPSPSCARACAHASWSVEDSFR
jgi:hypothetical protein